MNLIKRCHLAVRPCMLRFASTAVQNQGNAATTSDQGSKKGTKVEGGLKEFFDKEENWGVHELRALNRPGRSWSVDELRLKSSEDLHKLWYVLLKEKNMLLTMKEAYACRALAFPNPEREHRVKESMDNIEHVVHERNNAYLELETGAGASPPMRTVTSFMGFTYRKQSEEHYGPSSDGPETKEYEVPYLDDDAYMMQRIWKEKKHLQKGVEEFMQYWKTHKTIDHTRYGRTLRRDYTGVEQLPKTIMAKLEKGKR